MSVWLSEMLNIGLVGVEFCIYFTLADAFFPRQPRRWHSAVPAVILFAFSYVLLQICPGIVLHQFVTVAVFTALAVLCYRAKIIIAVFFAFAYLAMLNLSDVAVVYGFTVFTGQSAAELEKLPYVYCMLSYSAKFLELLIAALVRAWGSMHMQHRAQKAVNYLRFGIFPLATAISSLLLYIAAAEAPEVAPLLLFCVILLLVTDLGSMILLSFFDAQQQASVENSILHRQLDDAMDSILATKKSYENERRFTHEFQNQMIVIRGMLQEGIGREQITAYLDQVAHSVTSASLSISTNRPAMDVILNQKYMTAKRKGIDFQVRLSDLSGFPLPDDACIVLISNLLDNAIEACDKIPMDHEKKILVKMSVSDVDCILSVENTVAAPVVIRDNMVATTKQNPEQHGFGMKNIAAIVDSYDGYYTLRCDAGIFQFVGVFPGRRLFE